MKNVLITGGAGFIGSHLCGALLERGCSVTVLDRLHALDGTLFALMGMDARVEYVVADVTDLNAVRRALSPGYDTVFHLAAQPISQLSNVAPEWTIEVNAGGTRNVCIAAQQAHVGQVILASSACRYGVPARPSPLREDDPAAPGHYAYSESKQLAEAAISAGWRFEAKIARFVNVYGPGDRHFSRIIPKLARLLTRGEPMRLTRGNGSTVLDYLHVSDAVEGLIALAAHTTAPSAVFNFGVAGSNPCSVRELASLMSELFDGVPRELLTPASPPEPPMVKYLDPSKAQSLLGWSAALPLRAGLAQTLPWYRQNLVALRADEDLEAPIHATT